MPVGPIEIVRAQEATQLRHIDSQKLQHAQEQQSQNFQNKVWQDQKKPNQAAKSDNNEFRYDAKDKGNNQYMASGDKKKRNQKENEEKKSKDRPKPGGFDILI